MNRMKKILLLLIASILVLINNCGYKLSGYSSQFPSHIKTIVIPEFENKTTRVEASQFVTYAIKNEFIKRSKLTMVGSQTKADAILEGTIDGFTVVPIAFGKEGSANQYRLTIIVSVRVIDLTTDKIIFEGKDIRFKGAYNIDDEEFFSQETEELIEIAQQFAESVVITILEDF